VALAGAAPGNVLEVRITDVRLRGDWGWNAIKSGRGALPEDFPDHRQITIPIDAVLGRATLPWGGTIRLRPFFGIMAVAPPPSLGEIGSIEPRQHGGNMDNKELIAGSTLYLPVWNEGALFSVGDGHAVQGDGEVCLTALETSLSGTFELHLRKDLVLDMPRAETPTHLIAMGFHPDLDEAVKLALRQMIRWVTDETAMDAESAYRLCSLIGNLRVTQVVDGNKGIHMMVAKDELKDATAG
jgi:acetamidase/formamidase